MRRPTAEEAERARTKRGIKVEGVGSCKAARCNVGRAVKKHAILRAFALNDKTQFQRGRAARETLLKRRYVSNATPLRRSTGERGTRCSRNCIVRSLCDSSIGVIYRNELRGTRPRPLPRIKEHDGDSNGRLFCLGQVTSVFLSRFRIFLRVPFVCLLFPRPFLRTSRGGLGGGSLDSRGLEFNRGQECCYR